MSTTGISPTGPGQTSTTSGGYPAPASSPFASNPLQMPAAPLSPFMPNPLQMPPEQPSPFMPSTYQSNFGYYGPNPTVPFSPFPSATSGFQQPQPQPQPQPNYFNSEAFFRR